MVALPRLGEDERVIDDKDARIRLLICNVCNTIEPLPSFDGPVEHDETLNYRLAEHRTPEGHPHVGALATVSEKSWNDAAKQKKILEELNKARAGGDVGLGSELYDLRSTFQEDAMKCWRIEHNRTTDCGDYKSDRMKLTPQHTRGDRRELGLETRSKYIPTNTWLCTFCPFHTLVMEQVRKAEGYY